MHQLKFWLTDLAERYLQYWYPAEHNLGDRVGKHVLAFGIGGVLLLGSSVALEDARSSLESNAILAGLASSMMGRCVPAIPAFAGVCLLVWAAVHFYALSLVADKHDRY